MNRRAFLAGIGALGGGLMSQQAYGQLPMFLAPGGRGKGKPPASGGGSWNGLNALANPALAGWPDATNTGVPSGVSLSNTSGTINSSSNGQIIDALNVTSGFINVQHDNVTVKRCRVNSNATWGINVNATSDGCIIQDCEVIGSVGNLGGILCAGTTTVQRCYIHGFDNGLRCWGFDGLIVRDSYISGFLGDAESHFDGMELFGGSTYWIYHNTIKLDQVQTSTINLAPDTPSADCLIEANLVDGGGWCMNIRNDPGPLTNVRLVNNRFGTAAGFGYAAVDSGTVSLVSGNVRDDTGVNIDGDI